MQRRQFLRQGLVGGAIAIGAGGVLFFRRDQVRADVTARLLDEAMPSLTANGAAELSDLPLRAREEIRRYFHGVCLNVAGFVSHVTSDDFASRFARCSIQSDRDACLTDAFCRRVASETEILARVETIANEVGSELDRGWSTFTTTLAPKWNTRLSAYNRPLVATEITSRLDGIVHSEVLQAARIGSSAGQRPALGETAGKLGESAVLLLPLARGLGSVAPHVVIPMFVVLAAAHVWEYVSAQLIDRRGDYQAAISGRVALIGNRVAGEFEREVRRRIADLQTWQERAVREIANRLAAERIGLLTT